MADTVTVTGNYVFNACTKLSAVTLSKNLASVSASVFYNTPSLKALTIPYRTAVNANSFQKTASDLVITVYNGSSAHTWAESSGTAGITPAVLDTGSAGTYSGRSYQVATLGGAVTENITWSFVGGTLTISGTGAMPDYYDTNDLSRRPPWEGDIKALITSAVISDGITRVGTHTFRLYSNLATVTMADSVTSIGEYAFNSCSSLSSVTLSENLTSVPQGLFNRTNSLTDVTIPYNTTVTDLSFRGSSLSLVIKVYAGSAAYNWATGGSGNQTPSALIPGSASEAAPRTYSVIANDGTAVDYYIGNYSAESDTETIGVYSAADVAADTYVIFASFSSNRMTSHSVVQVNLDAGLNTISAGSGFAPGAGDQIKVMLWNDMQTIRPLSDVFSNI